MQKYRCIECKHCNVDEKKCYPQSRDCLSEYALTDNDIYDYSTERCDFYKPKVNNMSV